MKPPSCPGRGSGRRAAGLRRGSSPRRSYGGLPLASTLPWNGSVSSGCPTPASRRSTTRSPVAARSPRPTRSPRRTPTSASPRCPTSGSTGWRRCRSRKNVVHAAIQVVDIGGLVEGASKGEGLGNRFLANIREVDAIVFVLRAFDDDDVTGPSDPLEHLRIVELELALADLETVEKRLGRRRAPVQARQEARRRARRAARRQRRAVGRRCRSTAPGSSADQRELLRRYFLLTNRPRARRRQRRRGRARRDPRDRGAGARPSSTTPATTSR